MSCKVSTPVTHFELFLNLLFTSPSLPFQVKVFVLRGAQITESEAQGKLWVSKKRWVRTASSQTKRLIIISTIGAFFLQWSEQNVSLRAYHKYSPVLEGAYSKKLHVYVNRKEYEISDGLQIFNVMSSDNFDSYLWDVHKQVCKRKFEGKVL